MGQKFMMWAEQRWAAGYNLCVGLDPVRKNIPDRFQRVGNPLSTIGIWLQYIIQETAPYAGFYKPNIAFFEAIGPDGLQLYNNTIEHIHCHSEAPVIADMKRADIGNTNDAYLYAIQGTEADAVTLSPYLGYEDALDKIIGADPDLGCFILCKTSNAGAREFQDLPVDTSVKLYEAYTLETVIHPYRFTGRIPLYLHVAHRVNHDWNTNGNCGLVVGATYPNELAAVRRIVGPEMPILVPGIGRQGGDLEGSVKAGGRNIIVNASSSITSAADPAAAAKAYHEQIQAALAAA